MADSTLSRARALLEAAGKATPGPWRVTDRRNHLRIDALALDKYDNDSARVAALDFWLPAFGPIEDQQQSNAALITAARNDAPDIARAYLEATDLLERLTALPSKDGAMEIRSFMEGYVTAKAEARAFLAKHGEET